MWASKCIGSGDKKRGIEGYICHCRVKKNPPLTTPIQTRTAEKWDGSRRTFIDILPFTSSSPSFFSNNSRVEIRDHFDSLRCSVVKWLGCSTLETACLPPTLGKIRFGNHEFTLVIFGILPVSKALYASWNLEPRQCRGNNVVVSAQEVERTRAHICDFVALCCPLKKNCVLPLSLVISISLCSGTMDVQLQTRHNNGRRS